MNGALPLVSFLGFIFFMVSLVLAVGFLAIEQDRREDATRNS